MNTFYFAILFTIVLSMLLIIYALVFNKLQEIMLKLKEAEREIDETSRKKFDILFNIIELLKNDELSKIQELKDDNLSSFEFIRILFDYECKIFGAISSNKKAQKNNDISDKLIELEKTNIKLEAAVRYYNDNTSLYNNLLVKFPSNIVGNFSRLKEKTYFDGKDLNDKIEKDFKL